MLFPWVFDVFYKIGIFLSQTRHSGGFWLVSGHWIYPVISPWVKSTMSTAAAFSGVILECFYFTGDWKGSNIFSLASKRFIKEKN